MFVNLIGNSVSFFSRGVNDAAKQIFRSVIGISTIAVILSFGTMNSHGAKTSGNVALGLPIVVSAPTAFQGTPATFTVPISVDDVTNDDIGSFQFHLIYNPAVIDPTGSNFGCSTIGTRAGDAGLGATCNVITPGRLQVAVSGAGIMTGTGPILNVAFATDPAAFGGDISPLTFENVFFFSGAGPVANTPVPGQITLVGPTAANLSVSGRVLSGSGGPVRGALVTIYNSNNPEPRFAMTGPFGHYRFEGLNAGESYVIEVRSKQYSFTPRFVSMSEDLYGFDLIADSFDK